VIRAVHQLSLLGDEDDCPLVSRDELFNALLVDEADDFVVKRGENVILKGNN
jgi:hypothetical protein